ncbi:MAG: hypothetical protein LBK24_00960 [Puniceicoccales bacterium]|nr:hypothetical protein [Puniceicoccales bacterium]
MNFLREIQALGTTFVCFNESAARKSDDPSQRMINSLSGWYADSHEGVPMVRAFAVALTRKTNDRPSNLLSCLTKSFLSS